MRTTPGAFFVFMGDRFRDILNFPDNGRAAMFAALALHHVRLCLHNPQQRAGPGTARAVLRPAGQR